MQISRKQYTMKNDKKKPNPKIVVRWKVWLKWFEYQLIDAKRYKTVTTKTEEK